MNNFVEYIVFFVFVGKTLGWVSAVSDCWLTLSWFAFQTVLLLYTITAVSFFVHNARSFKTVHCLFLILRELRVFKMHVVGVAQQAGKLV